MVKKIVFISIVLLATNSFAKCYYVPCNQNVQNGKEQTKNDLKTAFDKVNNELKIVKEKYQDLLTSIEKNNKELDEKIALTREKNIKNKEILFLLKQNISLQSNQISKEGLE
ncbi:hypothetical protein ABZL51_001628 [Campylobacter jejuni]|nr:hypothetical protein [Campylobacter jejuni]ECO2639777.1 hypothetical protein [Campylobacter jejuni]HEC1903773.1 hypothetical protein [Campylobacter jejuni]HEC1932205.1 hypothetical protein [Campylobacter jejuni]